MPLHRFDLDAAAGNAFAFTLVPNDFGIADFQDAAESRRVTPDRRPFDVPIRGDRAAMVREDGQ